MTHHSLKTKMEMSYFNKLKNKFKGFKDFSNIKYKSHISYPTNKFSYDKNIIFYKLEKIKCITQINLFFCETCRDTFDLLFLCFQQKLLNWSHSRVKDLMLSGERMLKSARESVESA